MSNKRFPVAHLAAALMMLGGSFGACADAPGDRVEMTALQLKATDKDPGAADPLPPSLQAAANAVNYAFSTSTDGALADMSSGTTVRLADNQDDNASTVAPIGFDFYFQGVRYDRYSINSNGSLRLGATAISNTLYEPLAQTGQALITAYGADQRSHPVDGRVHAKVIGTAPNRVLVVEWLNMQANWDAGGTADLTYQVHLHETSGVIEFVYGSMTMSTLGAGNPDSSSPQIGFSSGNAVGTIGPVTAPMSGTPAPSFNGAASAAVNNTYTAGPIPVLTSGADGARRRFTLTPQAAIAPGGPLTFTGVSATAMTLNWSDVANETGYAVYVSTDGTTFSFVSTAAENATSFAANNLLGSTTYTWRVLAVTEGSTAALTGSQATNAPTAVSSQASGAWNDPATWSNNAVPGSNDAVTIAAGDTVTIDTAASAYALTVAGTLQYEQTTARTLAVATGVVVQAGGTLQSNPAGTQTGHVLSVGGSLTNDGTLDFSTSGDAAGAGITFTGAANATFGGSGATTDVRAVTVNKGTSHASVVELNPAAFTVRGVATDSAGWLTLTSGTLKLAGTFAGTSRVFGAAAYTIPAAAGFWLDNPNYTVAAQNGNAVNNGLLRITRGTFNQGTLAAATMGGSSGAVFTIEGGTINLAGRFNPTGFTTYNQSGGTLNVATVGNSGSGTANGSFTLTASATFNQTGGTINLVQPSTGATPIDYINSSAQIVAANGTLQAGTGATAAGFNFRLRGNVPNLVVDNTTNAKTATATAQVNLLGTTWIKSGATMVINGQVVLVLGPTFTNDGTLTGTAANTRFYFLGGDGPTTYTGAGTVTAPLNQIDLDNVDGLTIDPSVDPIVINRFNNFSGGLTGAGKLTIGNGGASTAVVQFGVTGVSQPIEGFDAAPVFNAGTGGVNLFYAPELTGRTTGFEMPPSRTLNVLAITNPNPITLAGGDVTVNGAGAGALALGAARVITGANTLHFNSTAGTITRTTGYVQGNLKKTFAAAANTTFEVGTDNGYSPVVFDATAGTFPADVAVAAIEAAAPGIQPAEKVLARHWSIAAAGVTANLAFNYLDADVPGTANEGALHVYRHAAPASTNYLDQGGTLDTGANTAALSGVTAYANFTLAEFGADLGIAVDDGVTSATPGGTVTYTITATNGGPGEHPAAAITSAFAAGLTCSTTCAGTPGSSCAAGPFAGDINDSATIASGGSVTYTAVCAIAANAAGSLTTTATIAGGAVPDANTANDSSADVDALAASADLAITTSDGVATAVAGRDVTYTITASNAGPSHASGATVTDAFPADATCTWTCAGAGGGTCAAAGSDDIADTVNLPAGGSVTYTAACAIAPSATGMLSNVAGVAAPVGVTDPQPLNNSATDDDALTGEADLAITNTDGVTSAIAGDSVTYTLVASNAGPSDVRGATVADAFPPTATCTWTCAAAGGASCTASGSDAIGDTVDLPAGGSATYAATCAIASSATGTLSNTATVTAPAGTTDATLANNTATDADTALASSADLSITATDGVPTAAAGGSVIYTIVASNAGPSDIAGATVTDAFPSTATCTWTCAGANGGTCAASGNGDIGDTASLPAGGSVTYTADCAIDASATGTLVNTATVAVPAGATDPVPGNNSATDTDTLGVEADLSITNTDGVTAATAGGNVTYTIVARNAGPADAIGASVASTFPADATCTWSCTAHTGGGTCAASGSGNLADTAGLPAGASVTYTADCAIAPSATGTLVNTATVTAPAGVGDPAPGNNTAVDTDTLAGEADLAITKSDGVASVDAGGSVTYTIVASNAGPSAVAGAMVTDTQPAEATCTWTCAGTGGATCAAAGSGSIGDAVNLPVGGRATYTASCTIAGSKTGTLVNTATIAAPAGVTDPATANNSATDTDTVVMVANASITVTDGSTSVTPGGKVTYTIVARNAGPSALAPANVTAAFPASLVDCSWTCSANQGGVCEKAGGIGQLTDAPQLAAGGSVTYAATCTVPDGMKEGDVLTNIATISTGAVNDPNAADNSATDLTTIGAIALQGAVVSGTMTANGAFTRGSQVTYAVILSNAGPGAQADNAGAEFTDTLPTGLTLASATATSGTATTAGRTVDWNGSIAGGASVTITIVATIDAGASGQIVNQGTVRYDSDGNSTNDATALTDDPGQPGVGNGTGFGIIVPAVMVPAVDRIGLLLMLLGMIGFAWHARRRMSR